MILLPTPLTFFIAFLGGILPALLWLHFWLYEDRLEPEPKNLLIATFTAGMVATIVALICQNLIREYLPAPNIGDMLTAGAIISIFIWAGIEEVAKFGAAYFIVLKRREADEPIDNMIYLITAALGFAALENAFFLLDPIQSNQIMQSIITGNMRFLGSTLLHIVSSASVGIMLAFAFCKLPATKKIYIWIGLILATTLHTLFNFFILRSGENLLFVFAFVWVGVIILILFFERVKRINRSCIY